MILAHCGIDRNGSQPELNPDSDHRNSNLPANSTQS